MWRDIGSTACISGAGLKIRPNVATTTTKIHITKLSAAQRQLRAAIRMFFAEEDELAIHTVASAAYGLIKDLKRKRGKEEAADQHLISIFYAIRSFRRGSLPPYLADDPSAVAAIEELAAQLPIRADSTLDEVSLSIPSEMVKEFWSGRTKVANFLKHADNDFAKGLSLDDVDNPKLLMQVLSGYTDLVHGDYGIEGLVLWLYLNIEQGDSEKMPSKFRRMALRIRDVSSSSRKAFCSSLIIEFHEQSKRGKI